MFLLMMVYYRIVVQKKKMGLNFVKIIFLPYNIVNITRLTQSKNFITQIKINNINILDTLFEYNNIVVIIVVESP